MSLPIWRNMWKYSQCDPLPIGGLGCPFDAVGLVWYRSWAALDSIAAEPELRQPLLDDELRVFSRHIREDAILAEEHLSQNGADLPIKLFALAKGAGAGAADDLPVRTFGATRVVLNRRVHNAYTASSGLPYQLALEFSFTTVNEMNAAALRLQALTKDLRLVAAQERALYRPDGEEKGS